MKSASPKKRAGTAKNRPGSPSKSMMGAYDHDVQHELQALQFQLGERDVEIERMKTTLTALNEKLAVVNDVKQDIEDHKAYFKQSEEERGKL